MNVEDKSIVIIPAQVGSKRLRDKNLQKINGKTLIEHAIDYALESKFVDRIIVSTNSEDVKKMCLGKYNKVEVLERPSSLCDDADVVDVYRYVAKDQLRLTDVSYVIGIQPDNPDRNVKLDVILEYCVERKFDDCFTVGSDGKRNGSVRVMKFDSLCDGRISSTRIGTFMDNCTNIHTKKDLNRARQSLSENVISLSGDVKIGSNRTFIIAEGACNHMCSVNMAKRMIMDAKVAGADAIKFQTYKAETHVSGEAVSYWGDKPMKQIDYYKKLDKFGALEYKELFDFAHEIGIVPFSTPFDVASANLLNIMGMELFKIPSMAVNDLKLLEVVASFGKPIIMSTGGCTIDEIDRAIDTIFELENFQLVLLACNLSYPTQNKDANLLRIQTLKEKYPHIIIGYSDHTYPDANMVIPSLAVSMGAKVIEKHYTPDKTAIGSGQFFSIDSDDLKKMVYNIRLAETVLGSGKIEVTASEVGAVNGSRKSLVVCKDTIPKGEILTADMLIGKRPGTGIPIDKIDSVIGKRTTRVLSYDEIIKREDIE